MGVLTETIAQARADGRVRTIREWRTQVYDESGPEFAARLGVRTATLYRWEQGTEYPLAANRRQVAEALAVASARLRWLNAPPDEALPEPPPDAPRQTIRAWRHTVGDLTQVEFAELVGVAQVTVSHWEQGLKFPQRGTRYRVAQRLGIHPSQIVWETGKTNANTTANDERPTAR